MDWTTLVVLGLFVLAYALAASQSWREHWALNRKIGAVIFLTGATVGVFFDDLLATDSSILPRTDRSRDYGRRTARLVVLDTGTVASF